MEIQRTTGRELERMAVERTHKITLIPGDGIGPEVSAAVVKIVEAAGGATGVGFEWHRFAAGAEAFEQTREYIPKALYESIEQNRVALKGPVTTPVGGGFSSINVTLRKKFDLFANFRPVKSLPGLKIPAGSNVRLFAEQIIQVMIHVLQARLTL